MTRLFILAAAAMTLICASASALDSKHTTGLPVPRFVSLRAAEANLRTGPGTRYPVAWVLQRPGLPVKIVAEFDAWRKIRDAAGTEGWVHENMVTNRRSVIITGTERMLRRDHDDGAPPVARLEEGVIGSLKQCRGEWCRIEVSKLSGWLRRDEIWGVGDEEFR